MERGASVVDWDAIYLWLTSLDQHHVGVIAVALCAIVIRPS